MDWVITKINPTEGDLTEEIIIKEKEELSKSEEEIIIIKEKEELSKSEEEIIHDKFNKLSFLIFVLTLYIQFKNI
jgi:hypothetical protein